MTGVIEHCDERAWSTVRRRSWSIVKTGVRKHCDDICHGPLGDNGMEHCDAKCQEAL